MNGSPGTAATGRPAERANERHQALVRELDRQAPDLGIEPAESEAPSPHTVSNLRRSRRRASDDSQAVFTLSDLDGVLIWQEGVQRRAVGRGRRGLRRGFVAPTGEVVTHYRTEKLGLNEVTRMLAGLDEKMGCPSGHAQPCFGLLKLDQWNHWQPVAEVKADRRVLVIVHGTFSNAYNVLNEILLAEDSQKSQVGVQFIADCRGHYDEILALNHPTVAVSPILNAMDLSGYFGGVKADIDVVAHSRGGLVTRWWLDALDGTASAKKRAVLLGSPLQGTSLAAPDKLRGAMSLLTNYGNVLKGLGYAASVYLPLLSAPLAILRLLTSVTSFAAKTPLIDAAVALVPGLAAQSKVLNNAELERLARARARVATEYSIVQSNFETADPGWKFWKYFRKDKLMDLGTDIVFDGNNDLVVDTDSMDILPAPPLPAERRKDFSTSSTVHHCNYFRQPETIQFLRDRFGIR